MTSKDYGFVKVDFDFIDRLKRSLNDESIYLQKIILNPYVIEPDLSRPPIDVLNTEKTCGNDVTVNVKKYFFKDISLSNKMLLRHDFKADFNKLRKRTCVGDITLEELTKRGIDFNPAITVRGHEHHLHLTYLDTAEKRGDRARDLTY